MTDGFENKRIQDLKSMQLLDTLPETEYDDITSLAAFICNTPIALISLVTDTREFFKSHHGIDITETPIDRSFCAHAIKISQEPFIVEDARKDERFKENPLVTGQPNIVFYAGIAIVTTEGIALGTLCVIDDKPRKLEQEQLQALKLLANQVVHLFELRKNRIELKSIGNNLSVKSQRLKNIIDATRVGTWEWDIPSGKVSINERWAEILGYTREELEPLSIEKFQKLLFPKDIQSSQEKIRACFEKKSEFYEGHYRFLHKKGHIVWIQHQGQVISWTDDGKPLLMAGTNTDITERINTETQFKTITNNIPGVVFRYKLYPDGKDELQLVSDGAKNLWGFYSHEVMENNGLIWDRYDDDDLASHLDSIQKSAEELSFWEHEWRYHHPDGNIRWHKGFGNPIRTEDGSTIWDSVILDFTHEKKTELEIEQSEKRFKGLVQNGSDLIAILDFEGIYSYVSPTSATVLGTAPEEFIGKNAFDFIHPDDKESAYIGLSRLKDEKRVTVKPFRFKHGDGSWRWIETIVTNLMDDPAVRGIVSNSRDITERIVTEEKLKQSETYYRVLYESQTNYVIRTDMDGNYSYVNKKFVKEFGWIYPDGKILGKSSMSSILDYHHQKVGETVAQCIIEPEKVFKVEIDKPTEDGKVIVTLWDFMCVIDTEGNPTEIQCVGMDITDRILSEKALKESEQRYSDLFHLSPQPMWVYDIDTLKFLDVNNAAIRHYGYSYTEFMKMSIREIRRESEIPKLEASVKEIKQKKKQYSSGEFLHLKKSGQEIIVEIQSNVLSFKGKEAEVVLVTDITERYKYIQAIEAQNTKLKKIAWTQSHLVRAPLTRIMGLADLMKDPYSAEQAKELLNHLLHSANELDEIIRNIVNIAQKE